MPSYLPVQGTHGWHGIHTEHQWWQKDSPFHAYMKSKDFTLIGADDPYVWSTDLDGVPFDRPEDLDWEAAGVNLRHYIAPALLSRDAHLPYHDRNLICHSHGGAVALYAAADGLRIRRLITICTPVRLSKGMRAVAEAARPNIERWLHIWAEHDWIQFFGSVFSFRWHFRRAHPLADSNQRIKGVGHSGLLNTPEHFHLWEDQGWIDFMM